MDKNTPVLIVDDYKTMLRIIRNLLKQLDIEPGEAPDAPIHLGGPVETRRGFVLHDDSWGGQDTIDVAGKWALSGSIDVLRATFPAGTLTGAPKVRAMELIETMEPTRRGVYGGACGYLSYSGEMDVAIAIRTGVLKDGMLNVQAAAGVVFDSQPEAEWQETEAKARAVLRAAEIVESGPAYGD